MPAINRWQPGCRCPCQVFECGCTDIYPGACADWQREYPRCAKAPYFGSGRDVPALDPINAQVELTGAVVQQSDPPDAEWDDCRCVDLNATHPLWLGFECYNRGDLWSLNQIYQHYDGLGEFLLCTCDMELIQYWMYAGVFRDFAGNRRAILVEMSPFALCRTSVTAARLKYVENGTTALFECDQDYPLGSPFVPKYAMGMFHGDPLARLLEADPWPEDEPPFCDLSNLTGTFRAFSGL